MANKKFTDEEMNHLRANPYVLDVSAGIVHFSAQFLKLVHFTIGPNIFSREKSLVDHHLKGPICFYYLLARI